MDIVEIILFQETNNQSSSKNKIKSDIMNECKSSFNSIRSVNKWI